MWQFIDGEDSPIASGERHFFGCSVTATEPNPHPRGPFEMVEVEECVNQAKALPGSLGVSLIDYATGLTICSAGRHANEDDDLTGSGTASVVRAVVHSPAFMS